MNKTKEDCLDQYMPLILDKNFTREEKQEFIFKAMEEYRKQGRFYTPEEIASIESQAYQEGHTLGIERNG